MKNFANEKLPFFLKYRPKNIDQLIASTQTIQILKNIILSNNIPTAFLFNGSKGVGKTTTARIIAKTINCLNRKEDSYIPCENCLSCNEFNNNTHLDITEIDAASNTSVDDIRAIIETSKYKPIHSKFRVFIIDETHMLSKSAFNALLKTLEEPFGDVKFILATTEIEKIPDTIISRCMHFFLQPITVQDTTTRLKEVAAIENISIDDEALNIIATHCEGSLRDGLKILEQVFILNNSNINADTIRQVIGICNNKDILEIINFIYSAKSDELIIKINLLLDNGHNAINILKQLMLVIYNFICIKQTSNTNKTIFNKEELAIVQKILLDLDISIMLQTWDLLIKINEDIKITNKDGQCLIVGLLRIIFVKSIVNEESSDPANSNSNNINTNHNLNNAKLAGNFQNAASNNQASLDNSFKNFEFLMNLLLNNKEMMLHSYLYHDVRLIACKNGYLEIALCSKAPKNLAVLLKNSLEKITNQSWVIDVANASDNLTFAEKIKITEEKIYNEIVKNPIIEDILKSFNNAKITIH